MAYPTDTGNSYTTKATGDIIQASHVNDLQTEVSALKTKVGVDSSAVTTTVDYLLKSTSSSNPGHKHTLANGATDVTATASEVNKLAGLATTAAELGYVSGVTSAIQTQLDAKVAKSTLTTKGDIFVATGASTVVRQAIGSDNQILVADSAQTNGLKWATNVTTKKVSIDVSNTTLTTTVTETTLYTVSIPGGTLSTNNGLRFRISITDLDMGNNPTNLTIRMKYGGTTMATVVSANVTSGATNLQGHIEGYILAAGTTSSQEGQCSLHFNEGNGYYAAHSGTAAIDSTSSQNLVITAQFSTATSSGMTVGNISVEQIA